MSAVFINNNINWDKGILYSPTIENVDLQLKPHSGLYIELKSNEMEADALRYDSITRKYFVDKLTERLNFLQAHQDAFLSDEYIQQPNDLSINYSLQTIHKLADLNIFPEKLIPSVEEGICMNFKNKEQILYFEIYNSGELGYIIEDIKQNRTLENEDVSTIDDMVNRIKDFIAA
jgi:hypothetical protein